MKFRAGTTLYVGMECNESDDTPDRVRKQEVHAMVFSPNVHVYSEFPQRPAKKKVWRVSYYGWQLRDFQSKTLAEAEMFASALVVLDGRNKLTGTMRCTVIF